MPDSTGQTILTIMIPTIPERTGVYAKLRNELDRQVTYCLKTHPTLGQVEVLVMSSKRFVDGGMSIGAKRNTLVQMARGKYLCFLDDDEWIAPNYVETLLRLCYEDKDVCTFRNFSMLDGYWTVIDMSLDHRWNQQSRPDRMVKRLPWHICPVRSSFAKRYIFPNTNYGEDWTWFKEVLKHCTTEAKTDIIIHQYRHSTATSEADNIVRHEKMRS